MTYPVTNSAIHATPTNKSSSSGLTASQLGGLFGGLPLQIITLVVNAILGGLGLSRVEGPIDNILKDLATALGDIPQGNIAGLAEALLAIPQELIDAIVGALGGPTNGNQINDLIAILEKLPGEIESTIAGALTGIVNVGEEGVDIIESWVNDLLHLLGLPTLGTGTGTGSPGTTASGQTLTQLLSLLNTQSTIPATSYGALTPGASKNVLLDPGFNTNAGIQGQGTWVWDGMVGNAAPGSIRTVRPGVITVYVAVGTPGGVFPSGFNFDTFMEWLQDPNQSYKANGFMLSELDATFFETVYVPWFSGTPASSASQGITWLTNAINSIPGPFILVGNAQGSLVMSGVYDQIRYGSLTSRNNDLLAGVMWGNMRREDGHAWPDYVPPAGTSGVVVEATSVGPYTAAGNTANPTGGNLIGTEDRWWDLCAPGDYLTSCPANGMIPAAPATWLATPNWNNPIPAADTAIIDEIVEAGIALNGQASGVTISINGPMGTYTKSYGTGTGNNCYFRIDSITKTFTGTLILRAVDAGHISLSSTLDTWFPTMANASSITIEQCLMMRSGVHDYTGDLSYQIQYFTNPSGNTITHTQIINSIVAGASMFTPGTQYHYTNANYFLLGRILELTDPGSRTYVQMVTQDIINALGLTQTYYPTDSTVQSPAATGYGYNEILSFLGITEVINATNQNPEMLWAAGALITTISDLMKWGEELRNSTLLSAQSAQLRMTTFADIPYDGGMAFPTGIGVGPTTSGYGLGFEQLGSWFGHDGSWYGYDSCVNFEPCTGTVIAVYENFQTTTPVLASLTYHFYNIASYLLPGSTTTAGYVPGGAINQLSQLGQTVQGQPLRIFFDQVMQSYAGDLNACASTAEKNKANASYVTGIKEALAIESYYTQDITSPNSSYYFGQPNLASGDHRSYVQIGMDYINTFAGGVHPDGTEIVGPPVNGVRHQLLGQRVAALPFQDITAGASVMWVNVSGTGDQILVGVNAYDANENLIATVYASEATITNPASNSGWAWQKLSADFVMPENTAYACLVLDVEPEAMASGIVWFDDCIFEPSTLIDAGWLNVSNIPQLAGVSVAGPQGQADILTAWQNLIDSLASAHTQTNLTGVQLATMLQAVGDTAVSAETALNLGVSAQQILSNPAGQPLWGGITLSGQVTFPLPTGSISTSTIAAGMSIMGFLNVSTPATIGFVEILAEAGSTPSGVYINVYRVNTSNGNMTNVWSSADISGSISTSALSWVAESIPTANQFNVTVGELYLWEVANSGSTAITVATETLTTPNKSYSIPPNVGAARTLSTSGGASPSTLTPSQVSYGGTALWACMSVSALPATYYGPAETPFTSVGVFPYTIPTYLESGDFIDLVAIGAGGAGGWADGSSTVNNGQGGGAGSWATRTLEYGTDIATSVTQLVVLTTNGGIAPSGSGGSTIIGYGTIGTPAFDTVGAGASGTGVSLSCTHTPATGAYVLAGINTTFGTMNVTYGGTPMTPIALVYLISGNSVVSALQIFGIGGVSNSEELITATFNSSASATIASISYTGVSSVAAAQNTNATGTALSQSAMCGANQAIVQFFGNQGQGQLSKFTGGTNRFYSYLTGVAKSPYEMGVAISDSTASATFGATSSVSDVWGGINLVLNPSIQNVLLTANPGQAGGPGGASNANPLNNNTTVYGLSPGDERWQGQLYHGGVQASATSTPGNFPGGGAAGGDASSNLMGAAAAGARGAAYITARRGASGSGITGISGGGGSELSVLYEGSGAGSEVTSGVSTSWNQNSIGGPTTAAVLIGAVDYSGGSISVSCTYGGTGMPTVLDSGLFYNASGTAVFLFAFGLIGIPSGNQSVVISTTGTATVNDIAGNSFTYLNVGSFGNWSFNSGQSTTPALSGISSASGQMVVGGFAGLNKVFTSYNQTQRWDQTVTASIPMLVGDAAGASSVSFTASCVSQYWGAIGGIIEPTS